MATTKRVAFQGEIGAYSEEAIHQFFGNNVDTVPCKTLTDVFTAVERHQVDKGLVPIENSLEGSIVRTYDLFLTSRLKICGETILRVIHCLISNPGVDLSTIKTVYSHPQALGQSREFLEARAFDLIATYDTAGSVKMIKEQHLLDAAAVASERAANVYAMQILAKGIETNHHNYTRFFVLGDTDVAATGRDKTSLVFSTQHEPGALFHALQIFAVRQINLTKIESRPILNRPWEYHFFLDFEGHRADSNVKEALAELQESSSFSKVLGSYPRAKEHAVRDQ